MLLKKRPGLSLGMSGNNNTPAERDWLRILKSRNVQLHGAAASGHQPSLGGIDTSMVLQVLILVDQKMSQLPMRQCSEYVGSLKRMCCWPCKLTTREHLERSLEQSN
jgi:hypothetical protein